MRSFVEKYIQGCDTCARRKTAYHYPAALQPLEPPKGPWDIIGVDLITELPETLSGYTAIIVFTDLYGKQVHAILCKNELSADGAADIFYREIFRLHGLLSAFVSDRGPQFAAKLMRTLLARLGIKSSLTTAYHPQANGQT